MGFEPTAYDNDKSDDDTNGNDDKRNKKGKKNDDANSASGADGGTIIKRAEAARFKSGIGKKTKMYDTRSK